MDQWIFMDLDQNVKKRIKKMEDEANDEDTFLLGRLISKSIVLNNYLQVKHTRTHTHAAPPSLRLYAFILNCKSDAGGQMDRRASFPDKT